MRIFPVSLSYQAVVSGRLSHPAANPLRLNLRMRDGESLAAPCVLRAELHTSRFVSANTTPLAVVTAAASPFQAEWNLDFSSAQMNQPTPPEGVRKLWLVVYATEGSTILYTFAGIDVDLGWHAISQATPPPPSVPLLADVGGSPWATAVAYQTNHIVGNGGAIYIAMSAHTSSAATEPGVGVDWETVWQAAASGSGDVVGPASATGNALARFDGTTGKLIQSSTATLSDAGALAVTDATVSGTLTASHIHGNLAGSVYSHVRNESGSPIPKGTPVYVTGFSVGQSRPLVGRADSASAATMPAIGILDDELANNASGHCVITGIIENLDTSGLAVNAPLYVASGGGLTATAPDVRAQPIAIVERVNVNNGAIIVTPAATNGSLASQSAANVAITGGSISGLSSLSAGAITASTSLTVTSATASTSTTTGALVVTGGVGVGGAVYAGADSVFNSLTVGRGGGNQNTNAAVGISALASSTLNTNCTAVGTFAGQNMGIGVTGVSITNAGSGGANGTYTGVQLTRVSGPTMVTYPVATIVVSGNVVTSVTITSFGTGLTATSGLILTAASGSIGGTTGFQATVSTTSKPDDCTAVGTSALRANRGTNCTAVGSGALTASTQFANTAIGTFAGLHMTSGVSNVFIGSSAGRNIFGGSPMTSASETTLIGDGATVLGNGQSNQIVIGQNAVGDGSNTTVIGRAATTQARLFGGNFRSTGANGQSTQLGQNTTLLTGLTGATVTAATLIPANSLVIGVTARVTTAITGATSFDIGDETTSNLFGDDVAVALGTTSANTIAPTRYAAATNVVLTANGANFTAGAVRLTVHFLTLVAPTS